MDVSLNNSDHIETGYLHSQDDTPLFYRFFKPIKPKASLLLIHGFGEHSGRYFHIINHLTKEGFLVFSIDFRGHGYSKGKRGHIDSLLKYEEDLEAALSYFNTYRYGKLFFLAHSMGALIGLRLLAHKHIDIAGMVLSSPLFAIKMSIPLWKKLGSKALVKFCPEIKVKTGIKGRDLSSDENLVLAYEKDPLVLKNCSIQTFWQINHACETSFTLANAITQPIFLQLAGDDRVVDSKVTQKWFTTIEHKVSDAKLKVYPQFLHEIYNEIDREQAINDALLWLNQHS